MSLSGGVYRNCLLASLGADDLALMMPHLQAVELKQRDVLCHVGAAFEYIYFLEQGVASVIATMEDGTGIEVGMVGFEGMISVSSMLGDMLSSQYIVMQLPGRGLRMSISHARIVLAKSAGIRKAVMKFAAFFLNLSAQSAACNRLHTVEQRLSRWLLMSSDRFESDVLPLTQEYLSAMLGVRRAGVSETAIGLQRTGLIRYTHGQITIVDRSGLEKTACECYRADYERFSALLR